MVPSFVCPSVRDTVSIETTLLRIIVVANVQRTKSYGKIYFVRRFKKLDRIYFPRLSPCKNYAILNNVFRLQVTKSTNEIPMRQKLTIYRAIFSKIYHCWSYKFLMIIICISRLILFHIKKYAADPGQIRLLVLNFNRILFVPGWTINDFPAFANTCSSSLIL